MGKRKYEKIDKIENTNNRNVTYMKRTKGLIKKSIELSVLCSQEVFLYIWDKDKKRVIHFASDPELDLMELFNEKNDREFLHNQDYVKVGGEQQGWDQAVYEDSQFKKYLKNDWSSRNQTSQIGNLLTQKTNQEQHKDSVVSLNIFKPIATKASSPKSIDHENLFIKNAKQLLSDLPDFNILGKRDKTFESAEQVKFQKVQDQTECVQKIEPSTKLFKPKSAFTSVPSQQTQIINNFSFNNSKFFCMKQAEQQHNPQSQIAINSMGATNMLIVPQQYTQNNNQQQLQQLIGLRTNQNLARLHSMQYQTQGISNCIGDARLRGQFIGSALKDMQQNFAENQNAKISSNYASDQNITDTNKQTFEHKR